jgi:high-affinity Fe2+/Pb2+ permease
MSAIIVDAKDTIMVSLGSLIGLVFLVVVGLISHRQIKKLPIGKIFKTSRWIFGALAVYFLYTGITELI